MRVFACGLCATQLCNHPDLPAPAKARRAPARVPAATKGGSEVPRDGPAAAGGGGGGVDLCAGAPVQIRATLEN